MECERKLFKLSHKNMAINRYAAQPYNAFEAN